MTEPTEQARYHVCTRPFCKHEGATERGEIVEPHTDTDDAVYRCEVAIGDRLRKAWPDLDAAFVEQVAAEAAKAVAADLDAARDRIASLETGIDAWRAWAAHLPTTAPRTAIRGATVADALSTVRAALTAASRTCRHHGTNPGNPGMSRCEVCRQIHRVRLALDALERLQEREV